VVVSPFGFVDGGERASVSVSYVKAVWLANRVCCWRGFYGDGCRVSETVTKRWLQIPELDWTSKTSIVGVAEALKV